jgi:alpha-1,6-mannosyltransferase
VGTRVTGFLGGYVGEEHIGGGGGIFLLELLARAVPLPSWALAGYVVLTLAILGVLAVRFAFGAEPPLTQGERAVMMARQAAILGAVLLVAVSPHYPWYMGWLVPLACLAPLASVLWLLATAPLLALGPIEHLLIPVTVYLPAAALAVWDVRHSRTNAGLQSTYAARRA